MYLREIVKGFGAEQDNCTRAFEGNKGCIAMSESTVHRERSRHIDVRKYYIRELVEEELIKLMPCGTKEMTADALTKSLPYPSFRTHRNTMLDTTSQQKMQRLHHCAPVPSGHGHKRGVMRRGSH